MKAKLNSNNDIRLIIGSDYIVDIELVGGVYYHDLKTPNGSIQLQSNEGHSLKSVIAKIQKAIADYEYSQEVA